MSWRAITEADVLTVISAPELEAFRSAALGDGQADPVEAVITQTTADVQGYVGANRANRVGPAGTIPETLLQTALDYMLLKIMSRSAGVIIDPEGARKAAGERAERRLRDVAAGAFAVEQPETFNEETFGGGQSPAVSTPERAFDRASQDGI